MAKARFGKRKIRVGHDDSSVLMQSWGHPRYEAAAELLSAVRGRDHLWSYTMTVNSRRAGLLNSSDVSGPSG